MIATTTTTLQTDKEFYMSLRAAYIQEAKSYEKEIEAKRKEIQAMEQRRGAVMNIVAIIENKFEIKKEVET